MIFLSTLLLAVLITIGMTPLLSSLAIRHNLVDLPGGRKVHTRPIPRIGGIAMACGAFAPLLFWYRADPFVLAFLAGAAVLVFFGLLDDLQDLPPKVKFAGQIMAALIVIVGGGVQITSLGTLLPETVHLPALIAIPLTLVAIVGATNAINLSDGLDGLAGGSCLLIFSAIGYLAYLEGSPVIGLIALALFGVLFGFLRFNTHPATIFMGDAGSQFLGFSAATLAIALTQTRPTLSPVLPLILLGFPILDTLTVMVTRIAQKRSPFSADKNHFHHHLLGLGLHQSESVLIIYVLQTLLIGAALFLRYYSDWVLLLCYFMFSTAVLVVFGRARRNGWQPGRFRIFNNRIAARLRLIKREGHVIKGTFPVFEIGIPLLLLATCVLAGAAPGYVKFAALFCSLVISVTWFWGRQFISKVLRAAIYLMIPFTVYLSETRPVLQLDGMMHSGFTMLFVLFAVMILFISKLSRRQSGFKSSPMDFLIIILAVAIPNLPDQRVQEYQIGLVAAKVIMFYFSFEVLLAEQRGKLHRIALSTVIALVVLAVK
jgi:UDP-GlcNAc:undecaprenyl-phosphate GlcNAc-1-phosphate transferase